MRLRPVLAALAALALASPLLPSATAAVEQGTGSASLVPVANLPHPSADGRSPANQGTDIEFATLQGKPHALAGSYRNGLQIIDVSNPEQPARAGVYPCPVLQGDVQVFRRGGRTYVGYAMDDYSDDIKKSPCYRDAVRLGLLKTGDPGWGTYIADITNPRKPVTVSYVSFPKGSHNHTIHPSGDYIYNSNSDLITSVAKGGPAVEIYDIRNLAAPKRLKDLRLPPVPTSLGAESHDITFNEDGTRAYSAALSQTVVINTEKPARPFVVSTTVDPTINVVHQADPVTLTDPLLGEREFLVVEDEVAGAIGTGQCPNGGVHVYDITGDLEQRPVKVGYWNIDEVRTTSDSALGTCTAHVFDLHEDAQVMTIAYYNGGVRVVDLSGLVGVALGRTGVGMKEVGFRRFPDSDTWAAKTGKIAKDGSFHLYGNDHRRGLDVYRFDPRKSPSADPGVWMGAAEAAEVLGARGRVDLTGYRMRCLPAKAASPVADALQAAHH